MIKIIKTLFYNKLVSPILHSQTSVHETSLATAIGIFLGLLPLLGVHMYSVVMVWGFCRYLLRIRFNLPVALALVWIINPITVIPVYYAFLGTGTYLMKLFGSHVISINYYTFKQEFLEIIRNESLGRGVLEGIRFLLVDLGEPMVIGSLVYAIPLTLISYMAVHYGLKRHREKIRPQFPDILGA